MVLIIAIISLGTWGTLAYHTYQTFKKEQAVFLDTTIE